MKAAIFLFFVTTFAWAHTIESRNQYWWIKGAETSSWRHDLVGEIQLKNSLEILTQLTYFDRFDLYDRQILLGIRKKTEKGVWEFTHTDGGRNKLLAIRDTSLQYGHGLTHGVSIWTGLKAQAFNTNEVHLATLGVEKEWRSGWFALSSINFGNATYFEPSQTSQIWGTQLRLGKQKEDHWKSWLFVARGEEAQALVALRQTRPLQVVSYGLGHEQIFSRFKIMLQLERSYYKAVQNRFESALLSAKWDWGN